MEASQVNQVICAVLSNFTDFPLLFSGGREKNLKVVAYVLPGSESNRKRMRHSCDI